MWHESIIRALEQEGILLRETRKTTEVQYISVVFDALAGHLVADAILKRYGQLGLEVQMKEKAMSKELIGRLPDQHPLASDIFRSLVGLVPRRFNSQQLWTLLDEPARTQALFFAAELEGNYIDGKTVAELSKLVTQLPIGMPDLFDLLRRTRGAVTNPLNAEFLDRALRQMEVADRDLRWTEWIRHNPEQVISDLGNMKNQWQKNSKRDLVDRLRARWVMWTLISTVRELRDQATHTLYWYGRGDAAALFDLSLNSLTLNDPYISERMLAASYGIVMANQIPTKEFATSLAVYLEKLYRALMIPNAKSPTSHWLSRLYVLGTFNLAQTYYQEFLPEFIDANGNLPFAPGAKSEPILNGDQREREVEEELYIWISELRHRGINQGKREL